MPAAPAWNQTLPSSSWVAPHCAPLAPVGSLRMPVGVQRMRNELTVLYSQLSIAQSRLLGWCSMFPARPKLPVKNSFLSAVPSPSTSVNFHTSSVWDSIVSTLLAPSGITNRGNTSLSTNTRWCS